MDFKEYQRCLAFCAMSMFRNCAELSAADRIAVFLDLYLDDSMNLNTAESMRTPADAIAAALKARLGSKIARFVPPAARSATERSGAARQFRRCWARMELSSTHGWPLWEAEVYALLAEAFSEIHAIFCYYGRSGSAGGVSTSDGLTLQRSAMVQLAMDIELAHKNFPMARVATIFADANSTRDTDAKLMARQVDGKGFPNVALELYEFLEFLVRVAFARANPRYGSVGHEHDVRAPLPDCLRFFLRERLLKHAKRDSLRDLLAAWRRDAAAQRTFKSREKALRAFFAAMCAKGGRPSSRSVRVDVLLRELETRKVLRELEVVPAPAITGLVLPAVHTNLSSTDVKAALACCQGAEVEAEAEAEGEGEGDDLSISYEELIGCLALCAHVKYERVPQMDAAARCAAIICNLFGEKDEGKVITEAIVPEPQRFDPKHAPLLPSESADDLARWLAVWGKMDLAHIDGFPLWEKAVFDALHEAFDPLQAIFAHYAKSGAAGSASASAALILQSSELTTLALDVGMATKLFPMARVVAIFARADLGDGGAPGDGSLELHEFLECITMLSFHRANPSFGQHAPPSAPLSSGYGQRQQGEQTRDAERASVPVAGEAALPDCLHFLLKNVLLKRAKTDALVKVRKMVLKEPAVQAVLRSHRAALDKQFRRVAGEGTAQRPPVMSMDSFVKVRVTALGCGLQDRVSGSQARTLALAPTLNRALRLTRSSPRARLLWT